MDLAAKKRKWRIYFAFLAPLCGYHTPVWIPAKNTPE
jgi:hypothetical protein